MALLSICIPTYNRSEYLNHLLDTIVLQKRFLETDDVEVIISDNCSEDNTQEISISFCERFPSKIVYFRNEVNVKDENFNLALSRGKGLYLKLNNDTLYHHTDTLDQILELVDQNKETQDNLFFLNQNRKTDKIVKCCNLDQFVETASFYITWIGGFGIWKKDYEQLKDFSRYKALQLTQTDVVLRLSRMKPTIVFNQKIFTGIDPSKKGGYDKLDIFLDNYTRILKEQRSSGDLSKHTLRLEEKRLLLVFITHWRVNILAHSNQYLFVMKNFNQRILKYYSNRPILLLRFYVRLNSKIKKAKKIVH